MMLAAAALALPLNAAQPAKKTAKVKKQNKKEVKASKKWDHEQVVELITKVNNYWQANNKPEVRAFWARGDGWVLAGLAKVLQDMPKDYKHNQFFVDKFQKLAKAVAEIQQPEGYWTRSMMDPEHAPGPETSGTAFFTYGMLWGVNNGYLNKKEYKKVIDRAWTYLTETAVQADGKVGYVQPIGERAIPGQTVDANSQANFGVGAVLLTACEYDKYLANK